MRSTPEQRKWWASLDEAAPVLVRVAVPALLADVDALESALDTMERDIRGRHLRVGDDDPGADRAYEAALAIIAEQRARLAGGGA